MTEVCVENVDGVWFGVTCKENRVLATAFGSDRNRVLGNLRETVPFDAVCSPSAFAEKILSALKQVYEGKEIPLEIPLNMERLPVYTQKVLRVVSRIPVGYVASYGGVAAAAGGGARAVGNVMANNPFAPIVPCHRVVTSALELGGYGGGLSAKIEFLKREERGYTQPQQILTENGGLKVFPAEFVLRRYTSKL
jgi:methylated-DNA-[protein]-cysteine S-methyltransferase